MPLCNAPVDSLAERICSYVCLGVFIFIWEGRHRQYPKQIPNMIAASKLFDICPAKESFVFKDFVRNLMDRCHVSLEIFGQLQWNPCSDASMVLNA